MRFDLGVLVVAALASLVVGSLVNALRAKPLPWVYGNRAKMMDAAVASLSVNGPPADLAKSTSEPPHEIRLDEFQSFVAEHQGLVLDARPAVFYAQAHVPGAVSLPRETFADDYKVLQGELEAYKDRPIAVYCSGADCPDSQLLTDALVKLGYRHLLIYTAGWEEWSQTGLPQEGVAAQP